MDLAAVLLTAVAGLVLLSAYFTIVSFHEKEPRAPWVGAIATILLAGVGLLIVAVPAFVYSWKEVMAARKQLPVPR